MNRTILGALCTAALPDTQDFWFEEIYRGTVEAINGRIAEQAIDHSVIVTRRKISYEDFSCSSP